ncbi:hypothetical protein P4O66_005877, partial [Electrophorus voltai]
KHLEKFAESSPEDYLWCTHPAAALAMSEESCDVVVVGAGLSGFSAAHLLKKRQEQWKVLVLEGKGRVGGRTLTQHLPAAHGEDMWDMGGQWVSSSQTHVMELIRELGLEVSRQFTEGKKIHHMGGANAKIRTYTSSIPSFSFLALLDFIQFLWKIERLCKTVSVEDPMTTPNAQQLDSMTLQSFMDRHIWTTGKPPALKQAVDRSGGTQQLSERLAEQVGKHSVRLGSAVTAIWQNEDHVEVKTATSTINCKAVIVTCPPHMADWSPCVVVNPLPYWSLSQHSNDIRMAFWKRKGFSGEIVARPSEDCPFGVTFDATSHQGSAALVGFIAGAQGSSWNSRELVERKDAVIASLVKYLGLEAASYIHYEEKDWSKEEYSGGCPVNVMVPGMLTYYHAGLRKPCGRALSPPFSTSRIYWAGTETATQWCGYLSGAVQAGQRAAVEVLAAECPSVLSESELQKVRADMNRAPQALQHLTGVSSHRASHFRLFLYLAVMVLTVGSVLWLVPEYGQY